MEHGEGNGVESWVEDELAWCVFADERLGKRFRNLVAQLTGGIGESIPMTCQDWAGAKAAYRFFSNGRLCERDILQGHFQSTRSRFRATDGAVLVLHDTTELSFQREDKHAVGITRMSYKSKGKDGQPATGSIR